MDESKLIADQFNTKQQSNQQILKTRIKHYTLFNISTRFVSEQLERRKQEIQNTETNLFDISKTSKITFHQKIVPNQLWTKKSCIGTMSLQKECYAKDKIKQITVTRLFVTAIGVNRLEEKRKIL
ncbi:hypothetical protein RFI_00132 [Reticulomyxa filosa]|uniref:Uncharacterized protein n=1 Tax=Reticulomyxa filosa TaxID=46433 RepID=X6PEM3_RETFI|nr:hypothetical protein RFI_00132 [Reticulomyxa filosa]|eukprot:ETO36930.1 hypothetical protein RFI_00132 [Reticulomyxa filosa]